jgi:5-(carboxyamino)imidazole ribonucleotide mutase
MLLEASTTSVSKLAMVTSIMGWGFRLEGVYSDQRVTAYNPRMTAAKLQISVVMGSSSDWETMQHAAQILTDFGISHECKVVSAHRMPDAMFEYAASASERGLQAIIAGAGGAAHLPGMLAAKTTVPVLGVPVASKHLQGVDSLHSMVQMPKGIPVATFAIGAAGAANAALFAVAMLALQDASLAKKLHDFRSAQTQAATEMKVAL